MWGKYRAVTQNMFWLVCALQLEYEMFVMHLLKEWQGLDSYVSRIFFEPQVGVGNARHFFLPTSKYFRDMYLKVAVIMCRSSGIGNVQDGRQNKCYA